MNDDLRTRLWAIFGRVEGGSTEDMWTMLDNAIDDGIITQEEFDENEKSIAHFFDDHWFNCASCGWTMPVEEMGEDLNGELACHECSPLDDEEY